MNENEFDTDLKKAITAQQRQELKDDLRSLEASLSKPEKSSQRFNWRIAASIALVMGLVSAFFVFNQSPSADELYSNYFKPYSNVVVPIVRDQMNLSKKAEAFALYERGEYTKAVAAFDALTAQDSLDIATRNFYKANAYMQLNKLESAKKLLEQVVDQNKEWKEESLWYLALLSLKSNNVDASISYLKKLQKDSSVFKSEVDALLKTLE